MAESITVKATIEAPITRVWTFYTQPEHVTKWNHASDDWHSPKAENDLREGGKFIYRMEAKDGSQGFDFTGIYDVIEKAKLITYTMDDGRKVRVTFHGNDETTDVSVSFDAEETNSIEMQKEGWQSILNNFKGYAEFNK